MVSHVGMQQKLPHLCYLLRHVCCWRATDSCFALIGARQCGVLMDNAGWLAVSISTTRLITGIMPNPPTTLVLVSQLVGGTKPYWVSTSDRLPPAIQQRWKGHRQLFLYPPQVKHLWFQQKQIEAISQSVTVRPNRQRGLFTVAQCRHKWQMACRK